jgi:SAM-dependent methyltransferase
MTAKEKVARMTMESQFLLDANMGLAPLVDTSLLPGGGGDQAVVRAAHRWYEHLIALWAPAIIEAAYDLGVFSALARGPMTSGDVADSVGADHRAMQVLLNGLYAYGLIERDDDSAEPVAYVLPDDARECLLPGGLYSLGGKISYDRRLAWPSWQKLADTVRGGARSPDGTEQCNQISESVYRTLAPGINFWAPPIVGILLAALDKMGWSEDRARRMLDVGCGTGLYSQLLVQRYPGLSATGLDVAGIAPLALEQAARLNVADRFSTVVCDFYADAWGTGFDLVFFANIFHLQTPETARILVKKAAAAVAGHGAVAIVDQIVHEGSGSLSVQDRFFRLFAASMLATGGGDTYTVDDYDCWLADYGLRRINLLDTPMHRIMLAVRR